MFDLTRCEQNLKKICSELEYEKTIVKALAHLVEFLDTTVWKEFFQEFIKGNLIYTFNFADRMDWFKWRTVEKFSSIVY
jgi:hypothetical protein